VLGVIKSVLVPLPGNSYTKSRSQQQQQ